MKRVNIFGVMVMSFILCSCEDSLSLDQLEDDSKLVIYAFASTSDTISISISASKPINGNATTLDIESIKCEVNGAADRIEHVRDTTISGLPVSVFNAIGQHRTNDEIKLSVVDRKLGTASSITTIPESPNIIRTIMDSVYYKGNTYTQIRISFNDNPTKDFYAVRIIGKHVDDEDYEVLEIETEAEPLLNNYTTADLDFGTSNDYYHNMYIFDDSRINGSEVSLRLYTLRLSWIEGYIVQLFALSPEYYALLKSLNNTENNDLGTWGLSFVYSSYTNVIGGYGCLGGYGICETEKYRRNHF